MFEFKINFCPHCGEKATREIRFGKLRPCCPTCGWVYFADPKVAVAVLIEKEGTILFVRRVNEPGRGRWSLPAGFVDAGEDPLRAAERECLEETGLIVKIDGLIDVLSGHEHAHGADIILFYRGEIVGGVLVAGDDVDSAMFFSRRKLPPLAFKNTERILEQETMV